MQNRKTCWFNFKLCNVSIQEEACLHWPGQLRGKQWFALPKSGFEWNYCTIEQDEDSCKLCNLGKSRRLDIYVDEKWAFQLRQCFPVRKLRLLSSNTTTALQWWGKRRRSFWWPRSQCRAGAKSSLHMLLFMSQRLQSMGMRIVVLDILHHLWKYWSLG